MCVECVLIGQEIVKAVNDKDSLKCAVALRKHWSIGEWLITLIGIALFTYMVYNIIVIELICENLGCRL